MAVSEERRAENENDPCLIARRARRFARDTARSQVRMAVAEMAQAAAPDWLSAWQARVFRTEIERLLSRI